MKLLLGYFALLLSLNLYAQTGQIIDQRPFSLPDSAYQKVKEQIPELKSLIKEVNFYHITYLSDGLKVKGYMAIPKKAGKYPAIIYNRGGNREFGKITDVGFVTRGLGEISKAGYVVVASQYRGNDGGEGIEEFGGRDINDVLNLIPLLANVPQTDTSRIGMFGWSRGGMMTYMALTHTKRIKAAVVGSGLTDMVRITTERPGMDTAVFAKLIPGFIENRMEAMQKRSAVYFVDKINKATPILILHGASDWRVPLPQVLDLVDKFHQAKQPFRFILFEGGEHALLEHRQEYLNQTIKWFHTYLRDQKKWPSLEPHGD